MLRTWRMARRLSVGQILHRCRLRARRAAARVFRGGADAGPVPPRGKPVRLPPGLLRPGPEEGWRRRGEEAARGRFRFLGVTRDLGLRPFPAPHDVSLLWAYHLEYMEYLLDLVLARRFREAATLARARLEAPRARHPAARHPYPDSRRSASFTHALWRWEGDGAEVIAEGAWRWARRVARNLEMDVGGNHLLENGRALALAGAAFRGRRAAALRARGRTILSREARAQILPDGGHFERSPMYHARVLRVLLEGGLALAAAGAGPGGAYWEVAAGAARFLAGILGPGGALPLLGDSVREPDLDPRLLLAAAREVLPFRPGRGPQGDRAYPHTGLYVFEDPDEGNVLVLDGGDTCPASLPAHGQADTFGYVLWGEGAELVVDPGVYEYAPGEMRDWCRSTRAHSTVEVDGRDSAEVWGSFRVGRRARVRDRRWVVEDGRATFRAGHDGYRHLGVGVTRTVAHLARGLWLVADRVAGRGEHTARSRIHLHPEAVIERPGSGGFRIHRRGATLRIEPLPGVSVDFEEGWYCPEFGRRRRSRLLVLTARGREIVLGYVLSLRPEEVGLARRDGILRVRAGHRRFARSVP